MLGIFARGIASVILIGCWGWLSFGASTMATLVSAQAAGGQFEDSDRAYVASTFIMRVANAPGAVIAFVFLLILATIWWAPIAKAIKAAAALALVLALLPVPEARAYYNKTDYADPFFILPNESAFFIPDAGGNKESQAAFGSEQYLRDNKIPAKRFLVPHAKLPATGGYFESDYYVPSGRLIIVDRTPVTREWVDAGDRGTAAAKQGFPCQSKEGLDVTVGIAIGTSVMEENSPRFLYRFGVNPPQGDRSKPEVIFTSVYYGKSLSQVMDTTVRNKVQSLVCMQIASHTLDEDNEQAAGIMKAIEADTKAYLTDMGITLDFIGWADTFTFGNKVQDAIDRRYVAEKDAKIAAAMAPYTQTLQALAAAEATRTMSAKWNGAMPSSVSLWWLPSSITDFFTGMFHGEKQK